jgi:hypothetical protein
MSERAWLASRSSRASCTGERRMAHSGRQDRPINLRGALAANERSERAGEFEGAKPLE